MRRRLKNIARGVLAGVKDILPIPTKDGDPTLESEIHLDFDIGENVEEKFKQAKQALIAKAFTGRAGSALIIIYLIDQIFEIGIF